MCQREFYSNIPLMDANVFTVFSSTSVLMLLSGVVCNRERRASSQGLTKSAASRSAKSATNIGQKTSSFQRSFQPVLQDRSKRKRCCFVQSCTVPAHPKSGARGSNPSLKEDTHPTSKPQQVRSVLISGTSAGRHIHVLIRFPRSRPSSMDDHRSLQVWLDWSRSRTQHNNGSDGLLQWPYPCHLLQFFQAGWKSRQFESGSCSPTRSPSGHTFRGRGGRGNIQQQQLAKLNSNRVASCCC